MKITSSFLELFACAILLVMASVIPAIAATAPRDRIIIRDIYLVDRDQEAEHVKINILIIDGRLEVVTKDKINTDVNDLIIDGNRGFILGKLQIGTSANFVILDEDPGKEIEILLDTKAHIQFAVKNGEIIVNSLLRTTKQLSEVENEKKRPEWLAYEPPPLALPLSYEAGKKWNHFNSKYVNGLASGALAVDRTRWLTQNENSSRQVGNLSEFDGGEIRALRFGLAGTLNFERPWVFVLAGATNGFTKGFDANKDDDFTMFDYRLDIPVFTNTTLSIGKQKEPISLERLTGMVYLPWQERTAASDALFPSRNHGIVINGMRSDGWMTWAAGAFNNWIDSDESFEDTANQLVGRLSWVPLVSDDESNLFHLGVGLRHTDAKQGIRYRTAPEISQAPDFADTGLLSASDALTYNLEAYWRKGPGWFGAEYIRSGIDSPEFSSPSFDGYHLSASWAITGEMRTYRKRSGLFNPLPVARPTSAGGWGAWEAAYRYSSLDLSDGLVDGGELDIHSIGLNWWLTHVTQFGLNYRRTSLAQGGTEGDSSAIVGRLLLILD